MIFGTLPAASGPVLRKPIVNDIPAMKMLIDRHRTEFGFVPRPALTEAAQRGWAVVAEENGVLVGFADWWVRRDQVAVLYHIVVEPERRGRGVGRMLVSAMEDMVRAAGVKVIHLHCPIGLPANQFYERLGFKSDGIRPGKRRELVVWRRALSN